MAKKIKKTTINGRSREKIRRMCIRLDKVSAALLGLAGISLALIWNQPYDLATTAPSGYPALFLLVLAGLPLELLEGVFRFIDQPELVRICGSFTMLGGGAFFTVILLWGVSRWVILRRYGLSGVKIAISLIRSLVLWGIFQICCFLARMKFLCTISGSLRRNLQYFLL